MDNFNIVPEIHYMVHRKTYPGWRISLRTIPDHELVLIVSGNGTVNLPDRKINVRPGMLLHFAPGVPHSLAADHENPMAFYAVHFDVFTFSPDSVPMKISPQIDEVNTPPDFSVFKTLFKNIIELKNSAPYGYILGCRSQLEEILFRLMTVGTNYGFSQKAERIISYIDRNVDKKLTLSVVASVFSINGSYLSKLFKTATGYTVTEYINKTKVNKAKEYIIEGNLKIKDISTMLGYEDPLYFSRVFKKLEGVSPAGYYKRFITDITD